MKKIIGIRNYDFKNDKGESVRFTRYFYLSPIPQGQGLGNEVNFFNATPGVADMLGLAVGDEVVPVYRPKSTFVDDVIKNSK